MRSPEPVVCVHGCINDGPRTGRAQGGDAISGPWSLHIVQRRGFGDSPPSAGDDFERDADDLVDLLDEQFRHGAHVVAHSYGALGAMFAAARRPTLVRSLALLEPPAYSIALHNSDVEQSVRAFDTWWSTAPLDDAQFLREWAEHFGIAMSVPDDLPPGLAAGVALLRNCRRPWTAQLPVQALATAAVPVVVVSGGHSQLLDDVCESLANQLLARHVRLPGAGHAIPSVGEPLNALLREFWQQPASSSMAGSWRTHG